MAQKPQVIDVTKSYIPGDPNSFPENLVSTNREDGEETTVPVNFYEGYNFLPTSYGYRSFFGTSSRLDIPPVPSRVQFILSYQSNEYINNLIALCEDGIWIIDPTTNTNVWKQVVTHTFDSEVFEEWTWCIIENSIYMYKQGGANVYNTSNVDDVVNGLSISIVTNTPTFLNMSGQMGIFKAGTRLGFWDSANSVAWSSNLDLNDFTPSLENLAGNTIFGYVIGRITHIRDHGEGFIVYSTKSIVGVAFSSESNLLWDAHNITNTAGVALGREVTQGINNSEHIVNSTAGLHRVGAYNGLTKVHEFSPIAVEISDVIRESREPVFLDVIEGRYLYLHIINNDYINGKISFETISIPSLELDDIPVLESSTIPPSLMVKMIQKIERDTTDSTYGDTLVKYVEDGTPFDIIEWEMSYRINSTLGLFEKYKSPSIALDFEYADSSTLDRRSIGWDNRTPAGSIFIPAGGDYNSLDMGVVLPAKEDFLDRSKQAKSDFSAAAAKVIRYQTDAFTSEDALGTYSPAYILKQPVDSIPSYLDIPARTSLGLLEGMYNIHSIWKDFEKRQDLAIKNFTEIVAELVPFEWKAYSTSGVIESLIEAPSYQIFDMFKPYGNIGIQATAGSKGFFYHKTYRDYYDCILAGVKNVTAINEYSLIDNGITDAPFTVNYFDALDIVPSINGVITRIPLTGHSDNYLQEIIEDSLVNGIYLNGFNRLMEFLPLEDFGIVAPWKMSGAITLGVRDFPNGLTTYWCECIPRQYLSTPNEWLDSNPIVEATISTTGTPGGSASGFPKPSNYPLTFTAEAGGAWPWVGDSGIVLVRYAIVRNSDSKTSEYSSVLSIPININNRMKIAATIDLPTGYSFLVRFDAIISPVNISNKGLTSDIKVGTPVYVNNISSLSTLGTLDVYTTGNTYVVPGLAGLSFSVASSSGTYSSRVERIWAMPIKNGVTGPLVLLRDVVTTQEHTFNIVVTPSADHDGYILVYYTVTSANPPYHYLMANTNSAYAFNEHYENALLFLSTPINVYQTALTFAPYVEATPGSYTINQTFEGTYFKVQEETPEIKSAYPYLINGWSSGGVAAFPSPSIPGDIFGYHQSFAQTKVQLASFFRNSEMTAQWHTGSLGDKLFRGSTSPDKYFLKNKGDYLEVWTDINNAFDSDVYGVVLLLRQVHGFAYMYEVYEEPLGSIIPAISVDLGGASIDPTLDSEGVYNTIGAFFTPKNKVVATLNNGVLTKGASTVIDGYAGAEAEILDYLTPDDSMYSVNKYLVPPTYDEGESFYYIKDAETIYRSCTIFDHKVGVVASIETPLWNTDLYLENFIPLDIPIEEYMVVSEGLGILPGTTFLIQEGTPALSYPTFTGAFVYDLFLKKWGKMKEDYKVIFSYSPVNSNIGGSISYTNFGMDAGVVLNSFELSVFDKEPVDSWIRLGKIGYYRLGNTTALEVKAMFRANSSGSIIVDTSLDGRTLFVPVRYTKTYKNVVSLTAYPSISGRWHTIKIEGNYDLQYLEFRGTISGRR